MVKTFNPNRVGGGTVSLVRAADGTYSLKEEGFDAVTSLNMIDLGEIAQTTTAATTETATEKTETTTEDQTKAAFMLPKKDDKDDPFTFEKTLEGAKDVSKSLEGVSTPTTVQDSMIRSDRLSAEQAAPQENLIAKTEIKSPTETVFGKTDVTTPTTVQDSMIRLESPSLKLSDAEKEKRKPKFLANVLDTLKGPKLKTDQTKLTGASERAALGFPSDKSEVARAGSTGFLSGIDTRSDEGLREVPAGTLGITAPTGIEGPPSQISGSQIEPPAKKTFAQSVTTAFTGIGTMLKNMPTVRMITSLAKQNNESAGAIALNRSKFNIVTSPGSMQGRIVGDNGEYKPGENLFHGMNRDSMFGNLTKAGQKRIDRREKTIEKRGVKSASNPNGVSQEFVTNTNNMKDELAQHKQDLKEAPVTGTTKPGQGGGTEAKGGGCVIATHAVNSGAFTPEIKREAVRWCVKNLHKTWWGEAIRRGYRYFGQKAINEGNAKNHYQEFKDYVAFGTGKKRTLRTTWTFIYRTIQFFIKGLTVKK